MGLGVLKHCSIDYEIITSMRQCAKAASAYLHGSCMATRVQIAHERQLQLKQTCKSHHQVELSWIKHHERSTPKVELWKKGFFIRTWRPAGSVHGWSQMHGTKVISKEQHKLL